MREGVLAEYGEESAGFVAWLASERPGGQDKLP